MNGRDKRTTEHNSNPRVSGTQKILKIPPDEIGRIIGAQGRNIFFINQLISPGKITVREDRVTLHGELENKSWLSRAIQVLHSARRGGIIKWFDTGYAGMFEYHENWLHKIRALERNTGTRIQQHLVEFKENTYDVWLVIGRYKTANVDKAIRNIGTLIHERHHRREHSRHDSPDSKKTRRLQEKRDKERAKKERSKEKTLRMKARRSKKQRHRYEKEKTIGLV